MSSDDESGANGAADDTASRVIIEDADEDTLRIMLSTDNHVGYLEDDEVRGNDSFAALEEVLYLAKHYGCDLVLLAGDLFHENKPSRRTMLKTMEIFRRYCMGPNPISVQILSDQSQNFRQGQVNYQNEFYSVDLPVMSIHGNHDDPSREGRELYAALDLLDCANLVNYIGRQDEINQIQISPILMKKGDTHLAIYALGSMRDARLNRMWEGSKVTFLQPSQDTDSQDTPKFFNLFALHQNRDKGRGSKNCVHESMIPEWMDLVCWGHEHECCIEPQESVVGTFRISQPGSSVATSLVAGEAVRKQVGILDIKGDLFRLRPIPLTQVRTFVMGEFSLQEQHSLDPDDPKVEQKVKQILKEQVELLIHQAKRKTRELRRAAKDNANVIAQTAEHPLSNQLEKPDEVLVRLKVEHAGFSALNNQRFGAQFIGQVGNPSDILLFQRKKSMPAKLSSNKAKKMEPIVPDQLEEMNIEDFITGELEQNERKLELFDEKRIATALGDYVLKQQAQAIPEIVNSLLGKQQKHLIKHGPTDSHNSSDGPTKPKAESKEGHTTSKGSGGRRKVSSPKSDSDDVENRDIIQKAASKPGRTAGSKRTTTTKSRARSSPEKVDSDDDSISKPASKSRRARSSTNRGRKMPIDVDISDDEYIEEVVPPRVPPTSSRQARTTATSRKKLDSFASDDSHDDDEVEETDDPPPRKKTARARKSSSTSMSQSSKSGSRLSQSQLSFAPAKRGGNSRKRSIVNVDSDDEEQDALNTTGNSYELDEDWGTAKTDTFRS